MIPRVTVILPNYNHEQFLDQRIQTILAQTYCDFELLYLDDASTDASNTVAAQYFGDKRVRAIYNESNSGSPFIQWNKGVREAKGEFVWIAESDDYADPKLLEKLVYQLDRYPHAGIAYCQSWAVNAHGDCMGTMDWWTADLKTQRWETDFISNGEKECSKYLVLKNTIPNASGVVFRRDIYQQVNGADESYRACGDWHLWAKMLLISDIAFVAEPLNFFRQHSASVTKKSQQSLLEALEGYRVIENIIRSTDVAFDAVKAACIRRRVCWFSKFASWHSPSSWQQHIEVFRIARRVDTQICSRLLKQLVVSAFTGMYYFFTSIFFK